MPALGDTLVGREAESAVIRTALESDAGSVLLIEGAAGIGKTALLEQAARDAGGRRVLRARGGVLERTFAYGLVRQLLEPLAGDPDLFVGAARLARAVIDPAAEPEPAASTDPSVIQHGLYWLTANLSSTQPLLLVADDLHWADRASVEWLVYLARRLEGLPVVVAAGLRRGEAGGADEPLQALRDEPATRRVAPKPLDADGVAAIGRTVLGVDLPAEAAGACHDATGGVPFYAIELLRALREDGRGVDPQAVAALSPAVVTEATMARLARMPEAARDVAQAVAILEPHAELPLVAELAGLDLADAATAADALVTAHIFASAGPCRFAHPILRAAIESGVPEAQRGLLHVQAARTLRAAGAPTGSVASHVLVCPVGTDDGAVATLTTAAAEASARGVPGAAAQLLERALAEPVDDATRCSLLLQLGLAESVTMQPGAVEHLQAAAAAAPDEMQRAGIQLALVRALAMVEQFGEAYDVAVAGLAASPPPLVTMFESAVLLTAGLSGRLGEHEQLTRSLDTEMHQGAPLAGAVFGQLGMHAVLTNQPREDAVRRLAAAMTDRTAAPDPMVVVPASFGAISADELDTARDYLVWAIDRASAFGSVHGFAFYSCLRGYLHCRAGDLREAEADIEQATVGYHRTLEQFGVAQITRQTVSNERGDHATVEALAADRPPAADLALQVEAALLRHQVGLAQLAQHRYADAVQTLERTGAELTAAQVLSPMVVPWRSALGLALAAAGQRDRAMEVAEEELTLARAAGYARAEGVALRAVGLIAGGADGLERLAEAVTVLEQSPARLELARAELSLGAALRRANRRADARPVLQRALDRAARCDATALVDEALTELRATGARPRRAVLSGADSLTASELRIARLAASGLTNREIAEALFVTRKTVEKHLAQVFSKLDVRSRQEIEAALAAEQRSPAPA